MSFRQMLTFHSSVLSFHGSEEMAATSEAVKVDAAEGSVVQSEPTDENEFEESISQASL